MKSIAIFVAVVDEGSFRGAARRLLLSPSVVSQHITNLEELLGTALFYRSTRAVSLTKEGSDFYDIAVRMTNSGKEALALFSGTARERLVVLRVSMPSTLYQHSLFGRISDFAAARPGILLDLQLTDRMENILEEGIDVAIRGGVIADSELMTRSLLPEPGLLVASPDYLTRAGWPAGFDDLANFDFISFAPVRDIFRHQDQDASREIWGRTAVRTDSMEAVKRMAVAGLGFALIPGFVITEELESGTLCEPLGESFRTKIPLQLVWPSNVSATSPARDLIDFLVATDPR
nr:LysR family transcriptional regulator [Qipengyuania qiaonensis]